MRPRRARIAKTAMTAMTAKRRSKTSDSVRQRHPARCERATGGRARDFSGPAVRRGGPRRLRAASGGEAGVHPQAHAPRETRLPPAGGAVRPERRDGVWDGLEENPRDTDPRDPDEAARDKGLMPKAPPLVLTQAQFRRACAKSGVGAVSEADARELFARRSTRPGGKVLEIEAFADAVLLAPQRGLGIAASATASARTPSDSAGNPGSSRDFVGKITYAPCRVGVFAPSDWDADKSASPRSRRTSASSCAGRTAARWPGSGTCSRTRRLSRRRQEKASAPSSRAPPDSRTVGQSDSDSNEGAGRTPSARWAWFTTARTKRRRFSAGTTTRSSRSPRIPPASGPPPARRAGRPACASGRRPRGREVARLRHAPGDRGVVAVAFGPGEGAPGDGDFLAAAPARLVTVAADATHCVRVWDWGGRLARRGRVRARPRARPGGGVSSLKAPRVRGAAFAPDADAFATFGEGHVKIWKPRARAANDTTATGARPQGAAAAAAAEGQRVRARRRAPPRFPAAPPPSAWATSRRRASARRRFRFHEKKKRRSPTRRAARSLPGRAAASPGCS